MTTYTAINLTKHHEKGPVGPDYFQTVKLNMPNAKAGELIVKQSYMSLDPAMFGWMSADTESYIPPVELGTVMRSFGIGEVVESNHSDFNVGDRVTGMMGWQEYFLSNGEGLDKVDSPLPDVDILSVFALPGLTATQGFYNVGKPKTGETLVVTGAAGSVGSIVGQLAKADGLRVIGIVGSEEKADWIVNELGFDGAINYKSDNLDTHLAALAPKGIDLFFENTGGPIQHLIYNRMNEHGRIVVCGLIADYEKGEYSSAPSWINVIKKRLTIQGFVMTDHFHNAPALLEKFAPYVLEGKIKHRSHVLNGLESAISGLNLFSTGGNKGKLIVKL
ncbi:NADP-dependent oxidoreductase [Photobacterium sp. OFAV2-7]|uniref:NADP-dependent oxidoreductase n=1 Tax=Photobacterium sp. OFAV2-7 TaxID=2917748 RepID=UPI001EF73AFE|nr:NADP-dependent oxidoreductase [Photobacterium sp. OFAV2-7]MCG7588451.1 NADP-dependent oxidoreductase [Photobacterium sp. OFAV2-7]